MKILKVFCCVFITGVFLWSSGIIPAIIPQAVPVGNKRGTPTIFQGADGTTAATAGTVFCDNGTGLATTSGCSVVPGAAFTVPNDGSTGTTTNLFAKINSSGNAILATTADTAIPVYVCTSGCGTTGSATLLSVGPGTCQADASGVTRGHFVINSTSTNGRCSDGGASAPTSGWVPGIAETTAAANATFTFVASTGFNAVASGGSPGGSANQLQYQVNGTTFGGVGSYTLPNVGTSGATVQSLPTSGWTIVNGALLNDFSTGITSVNIIDNSSVNWRFIKRSITVPYALIAQFEITQTFNCSSQLAGIYLTDGTKLEGIELLTQTNLAPKLRIETMTNVNTDSAPVAGPTSGIVGRIIAIRIVNNSTTRIWSYWANGAWVQMLSEASGTFLTETAAGPGGLSACNNAAIFMENELTYWNVQ